MDSYFDYAYFDPGFFSEDVTYFDNVYFDPNYFVTAIPVVSIIQIQGVPLPQIELINVIGSLLLGLQATPTRGMQYARQLATNGDTWEIQGLTDRAFLEQLFAIPYHGTIWVTCLPYEHFHATIEVEAAWVTDDAPELERTA